MRWLGRLYAETPLSRWVKWQDRYEARTGYAPERIFILQSELKKIMEQTGWVDHQPMPDLIRFRGIDIGDMEVVR